jgi:DNA repair protein SbcD/Mre11
VAVLRIASHRHSLRACEALSRINRIPCGQETTIPAFRFIHTADIHLDSPLRSLAMRDPALADLVGSATRQAFTRIIDLCLAEAVDALLIAGDLYDGDQTSMKTARFLAGELKRLDDAGIRSFMIRGNHDNLSRITRELTLPESVKVFGGRAGVEVMARPGSASIAIHGLSFSEAQAPESLLPKYRQPVDDAINIGLMHTSLGGSPGHSDYAPCSATDLQASGFRYWALGHIHGRSVLEGRATIVMPGMPQGRDINEAGAKSVTLVTVRDDGTLELEERQTGVAVFQRLSADMTGLDDWRQAGRSLQRGLEQARLAASAPHLICRIRLTGLTPLAWRIRRDVEIMAEDARLALGGSAGLWIEKVETDCREASTAAPDAADPTGELARIVARDVLTADSFRTAAQELAAGFVDRLPAELRNLLGADDASVATALESLAAEGAADVLARLKRDDAGEAA